MTHRSEHTVTVADGQIHLRVSAISDRGRVRRVNEDSYVAHPPVFLVADGMGGHMFGDRASRATAQVFAEITPGVPTTVDAVLDAVRESHSRVVELAEQESAGTTLCVVALVRDVESDVSRWMVVNIGDSRVYEWDVIEGLRQLSVDHSAVQEMIDEGEITREEAESHPERNVITRAIGAGETPDPDVWLFPVVGEQTFLICSDGLTKELNDSEIASVLAEHDGDPAESAAHLVGAALEAGGIDNVTVVAIASSFSGQMSEASGTASGLPAHLESTLPRGADS